MRNVTALVSKVPDISPELCGPPLGTIYKVFINSAKTADLKMASMPRDSPAQTHTGLQCISPSCSSGLKGSWSFSPWEDLRHNVSTQTYQRLVIILLSVTNSHSNIHSDIYCLIILSYKYKSNSFWYSDFKNKTKQSNWCILSPIPATSPENNSGGSQAAREGDALGWQA